MYFIDFKPMSVNEAYNGKKVITEKYRLYKTSITNRLPRENFNFDEKKKYLIILVWGFSSKSADWDNPIKPFQDILQAKYSFDDKIIYKGIVEKFDVPKGSEFIEFYIEEYDQPKRI
jgi:Holliday junction resolvase RusA-like endonuclease